MKAGKPLGGSRGFTLVEVLVTVGILTLTLGMVGGGLFQSLSIERSWRDDVLATRELRRAGSWFAGDALNAEATDLIDGGGPVTSVALTWTDETGASHTTAYSISGDNLIRDYDGLQLVVARRVVSLGISQSGGILTLNLVVRAEEGGTESSTLETYLRALK